MIKIITEHSIATTSRDHVRPHGTKNDNFANPRFNLKLGTIKSSPISILDLGCAGGGMIKSFVDQGDIAVGIEGSDYSLKLQRAEWASIPECLFTADITKPFQVLNNKEPIKFDVITAWEFLEHIEETDLEQVFANIDKHLLNDGLFIASINSNEEFHHRTVKSEIWWLEHIKNNTNLKPSATLLSNFEQQDFVRGGQEPKGSGTSFHVICEKLKEST